MKKSYYRSLLALPAVAFVFYSFTGGNNNALSGSPGDNNNTCAQCHGGGQFGATANITTNIPQGGYELNTKYTITLSAGASSSTKHGFQMVAENSDNSKVGVFSVATGMLLSNSSQRILHSSAGTSLKTWVIEWTSPSKDEGDITFYAVVNATNSNSSTSGDQVVTTKHLVKTKTLGIDDFFASQFSVYPNPATEFINLELPQHIKSASVSIYDYLGRNVKLQSVNQTVNEIDLSGLNSGIYYMSIQTAEGDLSKTIVVN